jgi:hypothetical protein
MLDWFNNKETIKELKYHSMKQTSYILQQG